MHREFLTHLACDQSPKIAGIRLERTTPAEGDRFLALLEQLGLLQWTQVHRLAGGALEAALTPPAANALMPRFETIALAERLSGTPSLPREILAALLGSPVRYDYPSLAEFEAALRVRAHIVDAASKTQLAFATGAAERPWDYWAYDNERGFTVRPGKSLIDALRKATQPENPEQKFAFSCYRATEYILLLAIAQELSEHNPALYARLQKQWETEAIMSGQFHEVFLNEVGSLQAPLPAGYYIPGDRLWFRNPDERSADIAGYEGSWVFYLGGGLFSNFWHANQPYTLTRKCLEIYHWRHGVEPAGSDGELGMDEDRVEACVQESLAHPAETRRILERMIRLRDGRGIYADGGCIDATRECARPVCPETADIRLP
ncbi:MAG: hypothetical protein RR412_10540, partial [Burkholderiaceae bacterium]